MLLMMFFIIPVWLLALLPQLIGGIANAALSQGSINRQNRYNSPLSQVRRLREAGLPAWASGGISAGAQSSLPDMSGIGNSLTNFLGSSLQVKQGDALQETIRKLIADADIAENLRDVSNVETDTALNMGFVDENGFFRSNAGYKKDVEYDSIRIGYDILKNQKAISDTDKAVVEALKQNRIDLAKTQLDVMLKNLEIAGQNFDNEKRRNVAANKIISSMEKNGLSLMEALFIQLMSSVSGGIGGGPKGTTGQIGF